MEQPEPTPPPTGPEGGTVARRNRPVLVGAVVVLGIVAALVAWLVIDNRGSSSSATPTTSVPTPPKPATPVTKTGPINLSAAGLQTLARAVGDKIYWAGPKPNTFYELTRTTTAKVYVRYLPPDVEAGAPGSDYLIVGTYPFPGAFEALRNGANGKEQSVPGGGIALVDPGHPENVYLAFPGVDYQLEVSDPSPERALEVALSGDVQPVAG